MKSPSLLLLSLGGTCTAFTIHKCHTSICPRITPAVPSSSSRISLALSAATDDDDDSNTQSSLTTPFQRIKRVCKRLTLGTAVATTGYLGSHVNVGVGVPAALASEQVVVEAPVQSTTSTTTSIEEDEDDVVEDEDEDFFMGESTKSIQQVGTPTATSPAVINTGGAKGVMKTSKKTGKLTQNAIVSVSAVCGTVYTIKRMKNEDERVNKALELLEMERAEYFNVTEDALTDSTKDDTTEEALLNATNTTLVDSDADVDDQKKAPPQKKKAGKQPPKKKAAPAKDVPASSSASSEEDTALADGGDGDDADVPPARKSAKELLDEAMKSISDEQQRAGGEQKNADGDTNMDDEVERLKRLFGKS